MVSYSSIRYDIQYSERGRIFLTGQERVFCGIPHSKISTEETAIIAMKELSKTIAFIDCDLRILKVTTEVIEANQQGDTPVVRPKSTNDENL